jgi:outer membrane PBP1 activator LpoA protein
LLGKEAIVSRLDPATASVDALVWQDIWQARRDLDRARHELNHCDGATWMQNYDSGRYQKAAARLAESEGKLFEMVRVAAGGVLEES